MTARRLLWTGPYAADLAGRAVARDGPEGDRLWIVATPMARDGLVADLTRRRPAPERPRVICWDDLWIDIARWHPRPPMQLSEASSRAAVKAAIERAFQADELGPLAPIADLPGLRRGLARRFAGWTIAERPASGPSPRDDDITRAEWAVFGRYRAILNEHGAEDAAGLAAWASKAIADALDRPRAVTMIDPVAPSMAQRRVIEWATSVAESTLITLPRIDDPDDLAVAPLWSELVDLGFAEEDHEADPPTQLAALEDAVFSLDGIDDPLGPVEGLSILGGPKGEGLGLILAREVARRLDEGHRPDDLLVLVRRWDDDASRAQEILRGWGIPVSGGGTRPMAAEPAIAALRLALAIPVDDWETLPLLRLLRNGQIDIPGADPSARAEAASIIQSLRVFRGRDKIEARLDRPQTDPQQAARLQRARAVFDKVATVLDTPDDLLTWTERANRLRAVAARLGLGRSPHDRASLEALWDALDDHALIRDFDRPLGPAAFAHELGSLLADLDGPAPQRRPGTVVFATVDEASGARARVVFLTNLAEGSFPTRDAVTLDPDEDPPIGEPRAYSVERLRFLRALGSARDEVVLLVPTTDEKGQELLAAGFVDDVRRVLGDVSDDPAHQVLQRLDPVFLEHPALARAPADLRVLAVALACRDRRPDLLQALLGDPAHRACLGGTAAGLRLVHERLRVKRFTSYDGLLGDPRLVARIAHEFGPDHAFSPSQIESFALCPFQFYQRYVLKLAPVEDRPELRADHASQGSRLHRLLEQIHALIASEGSEVDPLDRLDDLIRAGVADDLDRDDGRGGVAGGLMAIEDERVRRQLGQYRREFEAYREGDKGGKARPHRFEIGFGRIDDESSYPLLELGEAGEIVRLRGSVDRVDLVEAKQGLGFRVIDYKTGYAPSGPDVIKTMLAVQLPLYALAIERFLFADTPAASCEFGYWSLGRKGFRSVDLKREAWSEFRGRVVAQVLDLARQLRRGDFPVKPNKQQCQRMCDYKTVCRIGQARNVNKTLASIA